MGIPERPRVLGLLQALILTQVFRVGGLVFLVGLNQGTLPATFAMPAGIGDILMGVTAPLAVLAIKRGALLSWAAVVVLNILGITDLVVAVTEGVVSQASTVLTFLWVLIPTVAVPISTVLHLTSTAILMRRPVRKYFAQRDTTQSKAFQQPSLATRAVSRAVLGRSLILVVVIGTVLTLANQSNAVLEAPSILSSLY